MLQNSKYEENQYYAYTGNGQNIFVLFVEKQCTANASRGNCSQKNQICQHALLLLKHPLPLYTITEKKQNCIYQQFYHICIDMCQLINGQDAKSGRRHLPNTQSVIPEEESALAAAFFKHDRPV